MTPPNPIKSSRILLNRLVFILMIGAIGLSLLFYLLPIRFFKKPETAVKKIYYADNISPAHQLVINAFNEKYKGRIEVVPINLPFTKFTTNERKELIARSLRSKNTRIDIFAVDQIWVPRFARWALPLEPYFNHETIDGIKPEVLPTCFYDSVLVAIPLYLDIGVLFFRHDLLRQLPNYEEVVNTLRHSITWDDFISLNKNDFKKRYAYLFQADNYEGLICNYLEILSMYGGALTQNGQFTIRTPEAEEACQLMKDLIYTYHMSPKDVLTFNENESYAYSITHDVPFFRGWSSMIANTEIIPIDQRDKLKYIEMVSLPHVTGHSPKTVFGGWNLMISRDTEYKEAAVTFLKYCLSQEIQKQMYEVGSYLPVVNSVYSDSTDFVNSDRLHYLNTLIQFGVHRPQNVEYTRVSDILSKALNQILSNKIPIEDGLGKAREEIQFILKD